MIFIDLCCRQRSYFGSWDCEFININHKLVNSQTGNSIHYALSDFKTADGIRKGEDYMNNYYVSRYGAIKDVDFSSILEKVIVGNKMAKDE